MTPTAAELTLSVLGILASAGGVVYLAGRNLVTRKHLYRDDGKSIYHRADQCEDWCGDFAKMCAERKGGLADSRNEIGHLKTGKAVQTNEIQHLRRELNGYGGGGR